MNHYTTRLLVLALLIIGPFEGCKKKSDSPSPPDVSNFSASPVCAYTVGSPGNVRINSTSLAAGSYTIKYHFNLDTVNVTSQAALVMSNNAGTFQTSPLTNKTVTYVVLDSIANSTGRVAFPANTMVALSDSNGLMTGAVGNKTYRGVNLFASLNTGALIVQGIYYQPNTTVSESIILQVANYTGTGTYNFFQYFWGGYLSHITDSNGGETIDTAKYGTVTITAVAPMLTGSFTGTCRDSTKITGSFVCPKL